ncbi:MAG: AAA family ATPase [Blastocatellia bacterium]|nr:AAA family ATPase [Blastocatellia bacterium]
MTSTERADLLTAPPSNLPAAATSFVGRERDVSAARRALTSGRLLTLTGTGGIGKTRLALRIATESARDYADGVWFVELASVADPALVSVSIATAIGVRTPEGGSLFDALVSWVHSRRALIVLDNCEHLVEACAELVTTLLRSGPEVRILVTSREPLAVDGESVRPVPPLVVPVSGAVSSVADLFSNESVRLFAERARLVKPGFDVGDQNAAVVATLCRRLDGIPLAIELAAARASVLSVEQILDRMEDRFRLLTGGSRMTLPRHQTPGRPSTGVTRCSRTTSGLCWRACRSSPAAARSTPQSLRHGRNHEFALLDPLTRPWTDRSWSSLIRLHPRRML